MTHYCLQIFLLSLILFIKQEEVFPVQQLRDAHATATAEGWSVTDDAALFERLGLAVQVLEAPPSNIKLTTPFDLTIAEAVLAEAVLADRG